MTPLSIRAFLVLAVAAAASLTTAQSFNIDFEGGTSIASGLGTPPSTFEGAADQPGHWNGWGSVPTGSRLSPRVRLKDLLGIQTEVAFSPGAGLVGYRGFANTANTGPYAALMNDVADVAPFCTFTFRGLSNGNYRLYSYVAQPSPQVLLTEVFVFNSTSLNPQVVSGPMSANSFSPMVTHAVHDVPVTDGLITIRVRSVAPGVGCVNGFQLVKLP